MYASKISKQETFRTKIKTLQDRLLKTDKRNRAFLLSRIIHKHSFDLVSQNKIYSKFYNKLIKNAILGNEKKICICPDALKDKEEYDLISGRLKILERNIRIIERETGNQFGYLGFPFLVGQIKKNKFVRAPIVLFPITIEHTTEKNEKGWYISLHGNTPVLNMTLVSAMRKFDKSMLIDTIEYDFEKLMDRLIGEKCTLNVWFKELEKFLKNNNVNIDNTNYTNTELKPITTENIMDSKSLDIIFYNIVGNFPQGESAIYQDYDRILNNSNNKQPSIISDVLEIPVTHRPRINDKIVLDKVLDNRLNNVLNSDPSQDRVIIESRRQNCLVVQGPPGTGKSQVIVNLIANNLLEGKKVLVVCQKRAALQVVQNRLKKVGLDVTALLLDKEDIDKKRIYRQFLNTIDGRNKHSQDIDSDDDLYDDDLYDDDLYDDDNKLSHPSILGSVFSMNSSSKYADMDLSTNIKAYSNKIDKTIQKHYAYYKIINDKYFGIKLKKLYLKTDRTYTPVLDLNKFSKTNVDNLQNLIKEIINLKKSYVQFEDLNSFYQQRISFSNMDLKQKEKLNDIIDNIQKNKDGLIIDTYENSKIIHIKILKLDTKNELLQKLITDGEEIHKQIKIKISPTLFMKFNNNLDQIYTISEKIQKLKNVFSSKNEAQNVLLLDGREKTNRLLELLNESKKSGIKNNFMWLIKKTKNELDELLGFEYDSKIHIDIPKRVQTAKNLWDTFQTQSSIKDALCYIEYFDMDEKLLVEMIDLIPRYNEIVNEITIKSADRDNYKSQIISKHIGCEKYVDDVKCTADKIDRGLKLFDTIDRLNEFLTLEYINYIKTNINNLEKTMQELELLQNYFTDIREWDIKKKNISKEKLDLLNQCVQKFKNEDWKKCLLQEFHHNWIQIIEKDHPIIHTFPDEYVRSSKKLRELLHKKEKAVQEEIITNILYQGATGKKFSRDPNDLKWRELNKILNKKRVLKPIRYLIEHYSDLIFELRPCWLVSPEEVSKVFPLDGIFDYLIMDEASQLAVERALPALYRAKQIVITGDKKQLQPFDLFQSRDDDEEEEGIQSILSQVDNIHRNNVMLKWHYRSEHQALINFSNHAFYNGQLEIMPSNTNVTELPIKWIKCNGTMDKQVNIVEAKKVVDILSEQIRKDAETTIGIITFNERQMNCIMDIIDQRKITDPIFESNYKNFEKNDNINDIFVKNIENVQGDERDIIIFSIGYAKNSDGKFYKRFGTLNRNGGENRLNVAITRARKQMIIVSSMEPHELDTDASKNEGPQRLKQFLRYTKAINENDEETCNIIWKEFKDEFYERYREFTKTESPFEEEVLDELQKLGYDVSTQVGASGYWIDLAIKDPNDPNRYILGIECDGASFHSGSVRERDVVRQKVLEDKGWKIHRIWSTRWWHDPKREIEKIKEIIDRLADLPSKPMKLHEF